MKSKTATIEYVAPHWNRCITFYTSHGTVDVKVLGPDESATGVRNLLIEALTKSGLKIHPSAK
jgi:hypothetical protein